MVTPRATPSATCGHSFPFLSIHKSFSLWACEPAGCFYFPLDWRHHQHNQVATHWTAGGCRTISDNLRRCHMMSSFWSLSHKLVTHNAGWSDTFIYVLPPLTGRTTCVPIVSFAIQPKRAISDTTTHFSLLTQSNHWPSTILLSNLTHTKQSPRLSIYTCWLCVVQMVSSRRHVWHWHTAFWIEFSIQWI